jgi:hypothetical protein
MARPLDPSFAATLMANVVCNRQVVVLSTPGRLIGQDLVQATIDELKSRNCSVRVETPAGMIEILAREDRVLQSGRIRPPQHVFINALNISPTNLRRAVKKMPGCLVHCVSWDVTAAAHALTKRLNPDNS